MKHIDPVMKELWAVKDANAAKFGNIDSYLTHLRKLEKRERTSGRVIVPIEKATEHETA
jgi:hypothetical protein